MPTDDVSRLRCDDCGREFPVAGIVGPDGKPIMTAEQYLNRLHALGYELFCELCIVGRDVAWEMTAWKEGATKAAEASGATGARQVNQP